jgi:hypothetical protein
MPPPGADLARQSTPFAENRLLASIPRYRWLWVAFVGLLIVLSFNGRWRVGRDSAAYRGLGHHLATDGRYVFRDKPKGLNYVDQQDTRYPGLPLLLAGVERVAGRSDAASLVPILLASLATLFLSCALFKRVGPPWLPLAVMFGVGVNARFLEHANEILSDVPFLAAVLLTMLAFDRLVRTRTIGPRAGWSAVLVAALLGAAALRPTFWVLALTLGVTCVWGLFRPTHADEAPADARPRRFACATTLAVLVLAALTFFIALDLRGGSRGKYENRIRALTADLSGEVIKPLPKNVHEFFEQSLPEAFFGTQFGPGLSTVFSLAALVGGVMLVRRNVLWGVFVVVSALTMAAMGSVPRYVLMILPLLMGGWLLGLAWAVGRLRGRPWAATAVTWLGFAIFVAPNVVSAFDLIREQHGIGGRKEKFARIGFDQAYHNGQWAAAGEVAKLIRDNVPAGQRIFGPEATVLTYLSGRDVFPLGILLPRNEANWGRRVRKMAPLFPYALFPDTDGGRTFDKEKVQKLFNDKDRILTRMIERGELRPVTTVARSGVYKLCTYEVVPLKKRRLSTKDKVAATQPKRRPGAAATKPATKPATTGATTGPAKKKRPAATTRPATTAPVTQPATAPATRPGAGSGAARSVLYWPGPFRSWL